MPIGIFFICLHYISLYIFQDVVRSCCYDGWTRFGDSCYFIGHEDQTFLEAQVFCEHYKANLVNIQSSAENTFLRSYLSQFKDRNHWIGLTDELIEGSWNFYPSETPASFFDWRIGRPLQNKSFNCAAILATRNYQWVDGLCTRRFLALCEKRVETDIILTGG